MGKQSARIGLLACLILLIAAFWLALWARTCIAGDGAWSVAREGDVWWLKAPDGHPFYSKGINVVTGWADTEKSRNGQAYWWGKHHDSHDAWRLHVQKQFDAWGFNTAGGWSETDSTLAMPFIVELSLGRAAELHWFDLFSPEAEERTYRIALELTAPYRGDPRLIGYFTDNEVGWWNAPLFRWHLKDPWTSHAKQAVWTLLHETYGGDWKALTRDFVPEPWIRGWEELKEPGARLRLRPGGRGIKVVDRFTYMCARRYYQLVHDALRRSHPGALIMGDRLPLYYNQNAALAMRGLVDVISTNYNVDVPDGWVAPFYFEGLWRLTGTPVLISEYFFAARENRSGNRNNGHLMTVATQAERANGARNATRNFARFPNVVGAHWFQCYDEPTGGRFDGEDYNMGLMDIHGEPYEDLVQGFARLNPTLDAVHAASSFPRFTRTPAQPQVQATAGPDGPVPIARAAHPISVTDASLTDWDHEATRLKGLSTPEPYVPFGDIHLAWAPEGLYLSCIASSYLDGSVLAHTGEFPRSEAFRVRLSVSGAGGRRDYVVYLLPHKSEQFEDFLKTTLETEPRLYAVQNGRERRIPSQGRTRQVPKPLPHIAFEAFFPARELGFAELAPGQRLRLNISATSWFRALDMTWAPEGRMVEVVLAPEIGHTTDNIRQASR